MAELLKEGKWVDPVIRTYSSWDMQEQLTRTLYGMLLTKTWYIEPRNNPFIIVIDKTESTENPTNQGGAVDDVSNQVNWTMPFFRPLYATIYGKPLTSYIHDRTSQQRESSSMTRLTSL